MLESNCFLFCWRGVLTQFYNFWPLQMRLITMSGTWISIHFKALVFKWNQEINPFQTRQSFHSCKLAFCLYCILCVSCVDLLPFYFKVSFLLLILFFVIFYNCTSKNILFLSIYSECKSFVIVQFYIDYLRNHL